MTNRFRFAIPMLAALAVASTPALAERQTGEEKLAKMLEGREAGQPQKCIMARPVRSTKIIDGTAIETLARDLYAARQRASHVT